MSQPPFPLDQLQWICENIRSSADRLKIVKPRETYIYKEHESSVERLPLKSGNCYLGQLTAHGAKQMESVGREIRQKYIESIPLLPPTYDPNKLFIRSTNTKRTIETAYQIIRGLYPQPNYRNPDDFIVVHVRERPQETMYPRSACRRIKEIQLMLSQNELTVQIKNDLNRIFCGNTPTTEKLKTCSYWVQKDLMALFNTLATLYEHKHPLPENITRDDMLRIGELSGMEYKTLFGTREVIRLGIGRFLRELKENIENRVNSDLKNNAKEEPKFLLYSGHDNTLVPILQAYDVFDGTHPFMGSHIELELWREKSKISGTPHRYFVRFIYNNRELTMKGCNDVMCDLNDFLKITEQFIPENYEEECKPKGNVLS